HAAVEEIAGHDADGGAVAAGSAAVDTDVALFVVEVDRVNQGDDMGGVAAVEGEKAGIEMGRPPDHGVAGTAKIDVDGRTVGRETNTAAAQELNLAGASAEAAGEVSVVFIDR